MLSAAADHDRVSEPAGEATHRRDQNRRRTARGGQDGSAGLSRVLRPLRRVGAVWFVRQTGSETAALDLTAETFAQAWHSLAALPGHGGRLGRAVAVRDRPQPAAPVPQAQPHRDRRARAARPAARLRRVRGVRARSTSASPPARWRPALHARGRALPVRAAARRSSCASCSSSTTRRSPAPAGLQPERRAAACLARAAGADRRAATRRAGRMKPTASSRRPRAPRRLPRGRRAARRCAAGQRRQAIGERASAR